MGDAWDRAIDAITGLAAVYDDEDMVAELERNSNDPTEDVTSTTAYDLAAGIIATNDKVCRLKRLMTRDERDMLLDSAADIVASAMQRARGRLHGDGRCQGSHHRRHSTAITRH